MSTSVQKTQGSNANLNQILTQISSQLQSLQGAETQLSSLFSSLISGQGSSTSGGSANSSANAPASANSADTTTGLSAQTMSALIAASSTSSATSSELSSSTASAGTARLLPAGTNDIATGKPDMAQFMAATGVDAATASEILYGSIGSNYDLRDWSAIMSSGNPLGDSKASTAAMFNSTLQFASPDSIRPQTVLASTQNFAFIKTSVPSPTDPSKSSDRQDLAITDGQDDVLRIEADPSTVLADMRNFGFDSSQLADLESKLLSAGVSYRSGVWANGFQGQS